MPAIFISRGTQYGVRMLADCVRDRIGVPCITREDLIEIANQHGNLADRMAEMMSSTTADYARFSELRWPYTVLMRQALLEKTRQTNIVYHGYSGHMLLPRQRHFIRVRIEAPIDYRISMTIKRLECSEEEAREHIREVDEQRIKWARFMYAQDIRDIMLYDICLNMGHVSLDSICRIMQHLMNDDYFQATPESREEEEELFLATNVEAALVVDSRTVKLEISASVDKDRTVHLTGPYIDKEELETVLEIAGAVTGAERLAYKPGYVPKFQISNYS